MTFEDIISQSIDSGKSYEEIAKLFTDTLNKMEAEDKADSIKAILLDEAADKVFDAYESEEYDFDTIYAVSLWVAANKNPDWDAEALKEYAKAMANGAEVTMEVANLGPEEAFEKMLGKASGILKDAKSMITDLF